MQTCNQCQTENSDLAKFCKKCGQSLSVKICPNCHKENDPDAQFCQECGKSLVDPSKSVATPETIFEPESENQKESKEPAQDKIKSTVEKTQSQEPKPLRAVYLPSLLFGLGMALFISILQVVSGPYNSNDLFFTGISNVFIYGAVYSLFILVWRRYYKKTVHSVRSPDSGLKAFLIHIGCVIIIVLVLSFSLLTPAINNLGTSTKKNISTLTGCDPSVVGKWGGWYSEVPNTYNYLTLFSDGTYSAKFVRTDNTSDVYKGNYSCNGSKIFINGSPYDYSVNNGVLIIGSDTYSRK